MLLGPYQMNILTLLFIKVLLNILTLAASLDQISSERAWCNNWFMFIKVTMKLTLVVLNFNAIFQYLL